jgi:hypothetical protein
LIEDKEKRLLLLLVEDKVKGLLEEKDSQKWAEDKAAHN